MERHTHYHTHHHHHVEARCTVNQRLDELSSQALHDQFAAATGTPVPAPAA